MTCTFFGHRDTPHTIKEELKNKLIHLIDCEDVTHFLVGNNGNFDSLVQKVLKEISKERNKVTYSIVLSSIRERSISDAQEKTVFPEELETTPPRFAISRRNDWMIKHSDMIVCYTKYKISNSYKFIEKGAKKGLKIINLADQ